MNISEVGAVVRMVEAVCPAQKIDEQTAHAWHPALADIDPEAALMAVGELSKSLRFIAPPDIRGEVAKERNGRLDRAVILPGDPDNPMGSIEHQRRLAKLIGDGFVSPTLREIEPLDPAESLDSPAFVASRASSTGQSEEFVRARSAANRRPCERCAAPVGVACHSGGLTLTQAPAHHSRLVAAGLAVADRAPASREEFLAHVANLGPGGDS